MSMCSSVLSSESIPKISVIIPVYNAALYLRQCLDCVLNQTLTNIEVICVDDGSTDSSLLILREYQQSDSRLKILSGDHSGAGAARNKGLESASGDYLLFLDADDFFELDFFSSLYDACTCSSADVCICNSDQYDHKNMVFRPTITIKWDNLPSSQRVFHVNDISGSLFDTFVGWTWDKLFKRSLISQYGLKFQEQRTTNDLYFVYSALIHSELLIIVNKILVHQRVNHHESLSVTRHVSWLCFYNALLALRDELYLYDLFYKYERDFVNYALSFSMWNLITLPDPAFSELYTMLRNHGFLYLEISGHEKDYFYSDLYYWQYEYIMSHSKGDIKDLSNPPFYMVCFDFISNFNNFLCEFAEYINKYGYLDGIYYCIILARFIISSK